VFIMEVSERPDDKPGLSEAPLTPSSNIITKESLKFSTANEYRPLDDKTIDDSVNILREVYYASYDGSEASSKYR